MPACFKTNSFLLIWHNPVGKHTHNSVFGMAMTCVSVGTEIVLTGTQGIIYIDPTREVPQAAGYRDHFMMTLQGPTGEGR